MGRARPHFFWRPPPPHHYSILIYTPSAAIPLTPTVTNPLPTPVIFAAPAQCFSACSLEVTTNPSILCAPAQCFRAGAPPLSLLHINIHPLRRNSLDAGVTDRLPTPLFLLRPRIVSALAAWKSQLTRPFCVRLRSVSELAHPPYRYSI